MHIRAIRTLTFVLLTIAICCGSAPLFALGGVEKAEFDQFIRNIREDKRVDQLGYLVLVKSRPSRTNEDRLFRMAGKVLYTCDDGYLTHVNLPRLERIRQSKTDCQIIDKKRLDDTSESWYLVWTNGAAEAEAVKERFEPLFQDANTLLIRVREEDTDHLLNLGLHFSRLEESLLPLRTPPVIKPPAPVKTPDPTVLKVIETVKADEVTAIVQTLQDFKSRRARSASNKAAVKWLAEEFSKLPDLTVTTPNFTPDEQNVIAEQKGTSGKNEVIIVCGHMDSTTGFGGGSGAAPGADDNGSGAAGVLAIARALAGKKLPTTILYCEMNSEETGLNGSKAVAKTLANTQGLTIKAVFNMDMIAWKDDNNVAVIGNTRSNWLIDVFKNAAEVYTGLQSTTLYDSKIWQSDHSSFWNIGASAILTIEGYPEMTPHYHKTTDLVQNISPSFMEKIARSNLAALLTLNPLPIEKPLR